MRIALFTLVLIGAGCAQSPDTLRPSAPATTSSPSSTPIPVEATDANLRTACARRVLEELVQAFNAGDVAALEQTIGPGPLATQGFQWVSMSTSSEYGPTLRGPGVNEVDYTPDGARRLLLRHSEQGERWTLVSVRAGDGPSWHGGVDAEVDFERKLANGRVVKTGGKTALSCIGSSIYVLSLGDD